MYQIFFWFFACLAIFSALMVVTRRNIVHSALFLVSTFFWVAAIFVLMDAELLAAIQVLVYAGAIMVLIIFTILLIHVEEAKMIFPWQRQRPIALLLGMFLLGELVLILSKTLFPKSIAGITLKQVASEGNTEAVGKLLYTKYLLPFEVVSLLLLAAMIGAIVMAKREIEK
jgi:NADH-quinone oxidoreductase subunit J